MFNKVKTDDKNSMEPRLTTFAPQRQVQGQKKLNKDKGQYKGASKWALVSFKILSGTFCWGNAEGNEIMISGLDRPDGYKLCGLEEAT